MADDESRLDEMGDDGDEHGRGLGGFAAGVVFGALLGAGMALMFAPERGDTTRRRLSRRLTRLREEAAEGLERAGARTRREVRRRRESR
jgi:gas vesicle protein